MTSISVDVDIDPWDVIEELDEEEIADYLREDGWEVSKDPKDPSALEELDREDLDILLDMVLNSWSEKQPAYMKHRLEDKLKKLRYG